MKNLSVLLPAFLLLGCSTAQEPLVSQDVSIEMTAAGGGFFNSGSSRINFIVLEGYTAHASGADIGYFTFVDQKFEANGDGTVDVTTAAFSLERRATIAERAIDLHPDCTWVGFDPDYHATHADEFVTSGTITTSDRILFAQVQC